MGRAGCGGCKEIAACVWRMLILDGMVMALSMSPLGLYPVAACVSTSQCFSFTRHIKTPHRDGMLSVLSRNLRTIGGWDRRRIGGVLRALPLLSSQSPSSGAIPPGEPRMGISAASILVAHLSTGSFLSLSDLHDNPGAKRERKRVGRGIGSGSGKTSGRGMNGQKKRSSVNIPQGFEGGQTPMHRRLPKTGFKNIWAEPLTPLHVGTVQNWIDMGRLVVPADRLMTMKDLVDAGIFKANRVKHGIKLLARGGEHVHTPFHIEVSRASLGAIDAVEKAGGTVTCVHFNRLALRALLKPEAFRVPMLGEDGQVEETLQLPRRARPPPRLMPLYLDSDRRGYLSPEVQRRNKDLFNGQVTSEEIPKLALD